MTGEDKQISHCWRSLCRADIIMSLVSVRGKKGDKWLCGAALLLDVSNIWCDTCFIQGCSRRGFTSFITRSNHLGHGDRQSYKSVSQLIKVNHAINDQCYLQFASFFLKPLTAVLYCFWCLAAPVDQMKLRVLQR